MRVFLIKAGVVLGIVLAILVGANVAIAKWKNAGVLQQQLADSKADARHWQHVADSAGRTVHYVTDTVVRTATHYSVMIRRHDSLIVVHDTIGAKIAGDSARADAGTLARSCPKLASSCDEDLLAKDHQLDDANRQITILLKRQPTFFERHWAAEALLAAVATTIAIRR